MPLVTSQLVVSRSHYGECKKSTRWTPLSGMFAHNMVSLIHFKNKLNNDFCIILYLSKPELLLLFNNIKYFFYEGHNVSPL